MNIVDSHVHFWDPSVLNYPWLEGAPGLNRAYVPTDLDTGSLGVGRIVFVEGDCSPKQSLAEVDWVSGMADVVPRLGGIVASAPIESGPRLATHLGSLLQRPLVKGVRRLFQQESHSFITDQATVAGGRAVAESGLSFDACVRHDQLPALTAFARVLPELRIVLDHMGKPPISSGELSPWRVNLKRLGALPNVFLKLSGAAPEADPDGDFRSQVMPFLVTALETFGAERCMFGSDWPVSRAARSSDNGDDSYGEWADIVLNQALEGATAAELAAVAHDTATRFYQLDQ
ncbi:amidohydrolase family protein [Arthrobacter sp. NPDC080073]|uniref:amidohydrolase family protein n=1 Tax=Arthrobacter sp. NPDC080073 TaxID=3155919 RepID=UPI00341465C2